jgi:predicted PurR-regulated permease PerM
MLEILITIIIYILVIYGGHYLWNTIVTTYSTKKTKNLVDSQIQKYKKIITEIQQNAGSQPDNFLTEEEKRNMDESLTEYVLSLGGNLGSPQGSQSEPKG